MPPPLGLLGMPRLPGLAQTSLFLLQTSAAVSYRWGGQEQHTAPQHFLPRMRCPNAAVISGSLSSQPPASSIAT